MPVSYFMDLKVWQKSMDLSAEIYNIVRLLPREELYGLSDQMRRAVISIPSNIAEGNQRASLREYIRFLYIAKGSLAELITQIMLCERMGFMKIEKKEQLVEQCFEIGRMLCGLINKLNVQANQLSSKNQAGKQVLGNDNY